MSEDAGLDNAHLASTPTASTPTQSDSNSRLRPTRSVSYSTPWPFADTPSHHNHGTSYFTPRAVSPTSRRLTQPSLSRSMSVSSTGGRRRTSTSVSSSHVPNRGLHDDALLSEEDEGSEEGLEDYREHSRDRGKAVDQDADDEGGNDDDDDAETEREEDPITLKDRQSLINVEHPFGLPIWKPALYKKSRSVTRYADQALHSVPSAQAERHLLPGNILWTVLFGWWMAAAFMTLSGVLYIVPKGGKRYSSLVFGLGWYILWPFGKYVAGDLQGLDLQHEDEEAPLTPAAADMNGSASGLHGTITPRTAHLQHSASLSWNPPPTEHTSLLGIPESPVPAKSYGATPASEHGLVNQSTLDHWLGKVIYSLGLVFIIAPIMLVVCVVCWGLVVTIPMAKLNWALLKYMFSQPSNIRFCAAPAPAILPSNPPTDTEETGGSTTPQQSFVVKPARLSEGQAAPSGWPSSTVLLCTYRAMGLQYYKYTVGGVNILFINLLPLVFFVIFDGFVLLPLVERRQGRGQHVPAFLAAVASRGAIFVLSLMSVIPLSYFIGMAVASISAQSSIGMGAVINATFGSIIEIILYSIALTEGKGRLVEGSIVGSILAGVLLMPGVSMCSGAIRRKEQKFNAKSAGVTSTMLIMAIIGTLTPTLFYQTYGNFQLICTGCPEKTSGLNAPWQCQHCRYEYPDVARDPFYQTTVKTLMYFCATILLFSYLIGLWFSLRTHASQIWQNPQQLLHSLELPVSGQNRFSIYHRLIPGRDRESLRRKPSNVTSRATSTVPSRSETPVPRAPEQVTESQPVGSSVNRRVSYAIVPPALAPVGFTPIMESVDHAIKNTGLQPTHLPENMTADDFTRAVAVATVSALRHQQTSSRSPLRTRMSATDVEEAGGHGGHDAPSWSRTTSASVLLACTALYSIIAELLVGVVDVVLEGSGIDEKFLGITLFALVPNTTEFMNAMAFAMNGNIALSMEIGSAYALQVCLLQIPAMVAFSAWYNAGTLGTIANTFTLIFPRWDVVVIILSIFLLTYTYIEAKSNYYRGSILILSYLVLTSGFFFAPHRANAELDSMVIDPHILSVSQSLSFFISSLQP
ncbi:hypothetical protein NEOLEDRAFT_1058124 [Neolentinus lepideus HHB14362 ss-1]|uniref:Calcium permease n=1 Tax=Neolentinus lepideus HHB14362 ss-1 TaxID=1314782 RepID=A0A165UYP1_9AGAM|nr:hypothetical protein NEOLEDRAFT_1058124 [Neolentinus lepideus HHB14362 ss-1]